MRVFAAVELPRDVRGRIAAAARDLLDGVRAAKPVAETNLHVTVRFIGEVADASIDAVTAAVRDGAASVRSSVAQARGLGAFPSAHGRGANRPRVVWAGVDDPSRTLSSIEESISSKLAVLGYAREERPFSAHVTVARINVGARMKDDVRDVGALSARLEAASKNAPAFGAVPLDEVTLFRSDLSPRGPSYTALARFPLQPTSPKEPQ